MDLRVHEWAGPDRSLPQSLLLTARRLQLIVVAATCRRLEELEDAVVGGWSGSSLHTLAPSSMASTVLVFPRRIYHSVARSVLALSRPSMNGFATKIQYTLFAPLGYVAITKMLRFCHVLSAAKCAPMSVIWPVTSTSSAVISLSHNVLSTAETILSSIYTMYTLPT